MAKGWDKIKDKIEGGAGSARPADWEAMNAKIQAHPGLSGSAGGGMKKLWAAVSLLLIGLASWWYFTDFSPAEKNDKQPVQAEQEIRPLMEKDDDQKASSNHSMATEEENLNADSREEAARENLSKSTGKSITVKNPQEKPAMVVANGYDEEPSENQASQKFGLENSTQNQPAAQAMAEKEESTVESGEQVFDLPNFQSSRKADTEQEEISSNPSNVEEATAPASVEKDVEPTKTSQSDEITARPESSALADSASSMTTAPSAAAEDFYDAASGFDLRAVQFGAKYLNNFTATQGWQLGGDVTLNKGNWLLNAGLYYGQNERLVQDVTFREKLQVDSTFTQEITTRNEQQIRSYWIIDSFFAGHWENDTVLVQVTDTSQVLNLDTTRFNLRQVNERLVRTSYVEMPILTGYEFPMNKFSLQLMGGVVLNQTITVGSETGSSERFGVAGILQPALHYSFSPGYSAYLRTGMRYALKPNATLVANRFNYDIQLGIAIEW